MSFKEQTVRSEDGLGLYVRDYPPEGEPAGAPVFCLHGLTRNSKDFELVAPRLAAIGRRVVAMDVRGRGRSDWDARPENYNVFAYAKDALRVLDQLDVAEAVWVGTSMGGLISMQAAAESPTRAAAVVLNDVGPVLEPAGLMRIASYVGNVEPRADWGEAARKVAENQAQAYPLADDAFWMTMTRRTHRVRADGRIEPDYDPAISLAFTNPVPGPDYQAAFRGLKVPVLVLRGALSDLLSRAGVDAMRALKPDVEATEVPGVGHAPTLEEPPAWLPIVDFLARVP